MHPNRIFGSDPTLKSFWNKPKACETIQFRNRTCKRYVNETGFSNFGTYLLSRQLMVSLPRPIMMVLVSGKCRGPVMFGVPVRGCRATGEISRCRSGITPTAGTICPRIARAWKEGIAIGPTPGPQQEAAAVHLFGKALIAPITPWGLNPLPGLKYNPQPSR